MTSADLAFVNGAVYTVDAARTRHQAVAVKEGRIVAVGSDDADPRACRSEDRGLRSRRGGCSFPGSRTRTSTRWAAASTSVRSPRPLLPRGLPDPRVREGASGGGVDPGRRLVDGRVPRRDADQGPPRCGRTRPPCSSRTATDTARGRTPAPSRSPGSRDRRRSGRRADRARREGDPSGRCTRAPRTSSGASLHPPRPRVYEGLLDGQRYLHSLGITAWQDAIVSTRLLDGQLSAYLRWRGTASSPRAWSAPSGGTATVETTRSRT